MKRPSRSGHKSAGPRSKKADEEQATIIWVDEAGFYLLPMAVRTWAPCGQTPILRVKLTRDHLSAISGITLDGRLFMQVRPTPYDAEAVVSFLRVLLRKIPGKMVVLATWDIRSNKRSVVPHDGSLLAKAHEMGLQSIGSMLHVHSDHAPISKRRGSIRAPCVFLNQATSLLLLSCTPRTGFA